jgi:hypothetical protein
MGSTSIILGEATAPTSPTVAPSPASTARRGLTTLESATGGEVALLSAAPYGGVAVRASSTNDSPTTSGSGDLMWEREASAPRSCCGSATGLHNNTASRQIFTARHQQVKEIEPSRLYLAMIGTRGFDLKSQGLITAGILAYVAVGVRCASKPRRRASSNAFSTNSRLKDQMATREGGSE